MKTEGREGKKARTVLKVSGAGRAACARKASAGNACEPARPAFAGKCLAPPRTAFAGRRLFIGAACLLVIFAVLVAAAGADYAKRILVGIAINIVLAEALNLFNGFTGLFSLGHVGFMAIGAYASSILSLPLAAKAASLPDLPAWLGSAQLPFLPAILCGAAIATVLAFLVGIPLMRLSGPYVSVATMGFLVITQVVLANWDSLTRGARTFSGVPAYTNLANSWLWAAFAVYLALRIKRSSFGRSMLASRDDAIAARSIGIDILRSRLLAFCLSAFLTAAGGGLWAHFIGAFSPKSFYFPQTFGIITMVVIGGLGSVRGSVLGVVSVTVVSEILRNAERGFDLGFFRIPPMYGASQIVMAVLLMLVIVYRPKGMLGESEMTLGSGSPRQDR
jgi:branched-chain amino acid transport system permease protein